MPNKLQSRIPDWHKPAAVAEGLRGSAAEHKDVFDTSHYAFSDRNERRKRPYINISKRVKDLQVVEMNLKPSATALLIAHV